MSITVSESGNNWFSLMILSPLEGVYYWTKLKSIEETRDQGQDGLL
uniref:Uncharacterized protein n=1 Tax=Aegilops tauschii subsp. strangulata TaxID=200361 RepID=A0A452ZWP2_AEGTS